MDDIFTVLYQNWFYTRSKCFYILKIMEVVWDLDTGILLKPVKNKEHSLNPRKLRAWIHNVQIWFRMKHTLSTSPACELRLGWIWEENVLLVVGNPTNLVARLVASPKIMERLLAGDFIALCSSLRWLPACWIPKWNRAQLIPPFVWILRYILYIF